MQNYFEVTVVTQNIDNLHREAGNTTVFEIHGSVYRLRCLGCGRKVQRDRERFLREFEEVGFKNARILRTSRNARTKNKRVRVADVCAER